MAKRVDISKGGLVQTGQHTAVLPLSWLTMLTKELSSVTDSTVTLRTKQDGRPHTNQAEDIAFPLKAPSSSSCDIHSMVGQIRAPPLHGCSATNEWQQSHQSRPARIGLVDSGLMCEVCMSVCMGPTKV